MSICLLAGGLIKPLGLSAFVLAWTHSVEKVRWEETWEAAPNGLRLVSARVKGSGAGMEPPQDAVLRHGWWEWSPQNIILPALALWNSGAAGEWQICHAGSCRDLSEIAQKKVGAARLELCNKPAN